MDVLYFSIVTWTTLGYGDIISAIPSRMCAASEAICGYVFFTYAVRQGLRIDNPAHGIVKFAEGRWERQLTDDEYRQLGNALSAAAHQGDIWKSAIAATWLMILTGWRRGEVLGL